MSDLISNKSLGPELTNEDWRMIVVALYVREMDTHKASLQSGYTREKKADLVRQSNHCNEIIKKIMRHVNRPT